MKKNEIKCPKCGTVFQIDEEQYESILKQVKDKEFNQELELREKKYLIDKENALKLAQINSDKKLTEELNKKDIEIINLKNALEISDTKQALALKDVIGEKTREIDLLNTKIENSKNEYLLKEKTLIENYEVKLKNKDELITYYRDLKARQSTKMIGENLEQHCSNEFNTLRPLFGDNCSFEKDNDIKTGSKGDFIFRENTNDGTEILSIMFEMKNEADATTTKHKNEDFFKELNKDRNEKNCEYAVLVSLLEMDNDYYNNGIVDVSHKYPKMYVIRPQCFIPLITILRSASLKSLDYKKELELIENQNIDIANFENNMRAFKEGFSRNYRLASEKFNSAILDIDKTIQHLEKIKKSLLSSEKNLRIANEKADDLTIKKLTSNSPSIAKMFDDLNEEKC